MNVTFGDVLLFGLPIALGGLLIAIVRWSQRKSAELKRSDPYLNAFSGWIVYKRRDLARATRFFFFGESPRSEKLIANALIMLTIVGVVAVLVYVCFSIFIDH